MAGMKFLVLENNERIMRIYQKIFISKEYQVDFVEDELNCFKKFNKSLMDCYNYIILEKSIKIDNLPLEDKIREVNPLQKILFLSHHMDQQNPEISKEIHDLIEKPFAMVTLLGKIELEKLRPTIKVK